MTDWHGQHISTSVCRITGALPIPLASFILSCITRDPHHPLHSEVEDAHSQLATSQTGLSFNINP